jgi:hypothetical protein
LDLSPDGELRNPSLEFQSSGPAAGYLRRLRSSLVSFAETPLSDTRQEQVEDALEPAPSPVHPAPSAPPDLRPASSVPAMEVYPFDPARVRDWTHRVLRALRESVGFYTWAASRPDADDGFRVAATALGGAPNDFVRWVRGEESAPSSLARMNCWEALLYTAYWSGAVGKEWLERIHREAARAADEVYRTRLRSGLGSFGASLG